MCACMHVRACVRARAASAIIKYFCGRQESCSDAFARMQVAAATG